MCRLTLAGEPDPPPPLFFRFLTFSCSRVPLAKAATPGANKLTVMKLSDLHRIPRAQREDDDGDTEAGLDLDGDDSDDDEECDEVPTKHKQ